MANAAADDNEQALHPCALQQIRQIQHSSSESGVICRGWQHLLTSAVVLLHASIPLRGVRSSEAQCYRADEVGHMSSTALLGIVTGAHHDPVVRGFGI